MNVKSLLWRKWLSLALAGLLASSCLVSCGGDGEQSTPTTEAETQAPAGETDEQNALLLSNGERALYRIVYPMIANTCLNEAMQLLILYFYRLIHNF